ncbi:MAG: YdcF family protein [Pseudonocardiaceae bacterium]
MPTGHIIFGTNQAAPAELVARRYHQGLAPFIILTGGVNRYTGVLEAIEHRRILLEHGVSEATLRYEDSSTTTQGNVEQALPFLHEALHSGLVLTAVCKWYHRRAIQLLRALLPAEPFFHAVTWEPVYDGVTVTRAGWWLESPVAAQRVIKEWRVIPERLAAGSLKEVELIDGAWR